ncbi:MAG: energy transducer TonB, partial [Chitinophagaceae bacterium]
HMQHNKCEIFRIFEVNFNLLEFYADGKRKTIGKVSVFEPRLMYEGAIMKFNQEGKRKEISTFEKGIPKGTSYHYFNNGKLQKQLEYLPYQGSLPMDRPEIKLAEVPFNIGFKLIYLADSLGVEHVKDGNGHVKNIEVFEKNIRTEEGDYKDGVKHGTWNGSETINATNFTETYENGKLMGGESTKNGIKYPYTSEMSFPSFNGGMKKFYERVGYSVRYPADAAKERIGGTVIVEFTVEKDGKVTDVDVKKSVYPSLDEEAIRVVRASPKWIPATQRGVPVRVKYSIPLKFTMRQ